MRITKRNLLALTLSTALTLPSIALAQDGAIKIGLLATFEGAFTVLGEDGERGAMTAVNEFGGEVAGHEIEIIRGSSDASPDSAVRAARKLVEQDGVKVLVGPLSGDEGIAVKDYAKTQPDVTFINGSSAAQDTTFRDPADNFFRFSTDGAQWMAGLGTYVYNEKGYQSVATVAEDYSFPYTQVFGFMAEFCNAGGTVPSKSWVPIGNKDYSSVIAAIPDDVDAIYVALGGADAVNFLSQYQQAGGEAPLIGGSITVDQTVLTSEGRLRDILIGTPAAGPTADTNDSEAWLSFVDEYKNTDGAFPSPSLFAHGYYIGMKAALLALEETGGDLSDPAAYREALANLEFETPTGKVSLDENRNAIADIYLTEVVEGPDGNLVNKLIQTTSQVNQTLGIDKEEFRALGAVSRENPSCP
ncbi:ABC transporter substrate-binding protein [Phaeobacter sp. 22II1-1F12B]|uniref:ABC transporter substrate-binding protein n=1 Tax=Phaeobacter sp. 22II1-1F12B TaxID=1317111 RepID=UPI000B5242B9|nr:ABC transporter substrate-binding protein [Phaeobacter sp. 22II1-1F12B]